MKKVLVAGEVNVDLILQGYRAFPSPGKEVLVEDCALTLGSASIICAAGMARLGRPVAFVGRAGRDVFGDYCTREMRDLGIDVSPVIRDEAMKTGVTASIASPRDRALVTFLGSIASLQPEDVPDALLAGYQHLHVSSYYLQERLRPGCRELFGRARQLGLTTSLDPGFDPAERWDDDLRATLAEVDLFFPNEVELAGLGGHDDPVQALRRLSNGRTRIVAKLGPAGCLTLDDGAPLRVPAFPAVAIDTTGAGDSFNAGFLHAYLEGAPLPDCLAWGAACGALSTRGLGGTAAQATTDEALALLRSRP
jgi:sugar/nucleoside kinase (ribokinase family)